MKEFLKRRLSLSSLHKLQKLSQYFIKVVPFGLNLNILGMVYGTDKNLGHSYTTHYMTHLNRFKYKRINLLEIGVGGYKDPYSGGESLRMWKKYFPFGKIFSIDIYDKSSLQENRIKIFKGSQVDSEFLYRVTDEIGGIDIIIDDGSHVNEHVIETFNHLFPRLKDGGIYVIEDTQTSYWENFGGDSKDLNNPKTMMNFFKNLTDSLNNQEFIIPNYKQSYFDKKIISMHFYHNMIFVYKGDNDEKSNIIVNNQ
jgi:demethylmacrocin O-methyltransferase